ncbi:hypothetical protein PRO82_001437 [Candidatus Protochlamydia amoebophila]|nr:hypothetical protein [Candidatus Protochlamydia amoebophila]
MGRYYDDFTGSSYARNKRVSRRHRKPSDPRVFSLFFTEEGRNVTKKSRKRVKNVDSEFFSKSPEKQSDVNKFIVRTYRLIFMGRKQRYL